MAGYQNPYGYTPYTGFQPNTYYPNYQQPVTQQQTSTNVSLMTVFVNSDQEVDEYPVAAGVTVQLINFKAGKFYLKSTGTNGVPQPIRRFSFTEDSMPAQNQNGAVSRDEFNALSEKFDKLLKELGGGDSK